MPFLSRPVPQRVLDAYDTVDEAAIVAHQLERVNALWTQASRRVPHYAAMKEQRDLHGTFGSLEDYANRVPLLELADLASPDARCSFPWPPPDRYRVRHETQAPVLRLPAWKVEFAHTAHDAWIGRSWYGVTPGDRLFRWESAMRSETGWRSQLRGLIALAKDSLTGQARYLTHDFSDETAEKVAAALLIARPACLMAPAFALDSFARVNEHRSEDLRALRLKAVIATGGTFSRDDRIARIERMFGAPVGYETATAETGVVAHSAPGRGMRTLWRSHLVETRHIDGADELVVTTLTPRCTPLFRYRLGEAFASNRLERAGSVSIVSFGMHAT